MHEKNREIKECIDMRACSYTNWNKKFRKITYNSICIPLPEHIVKYFLDEVIILPKECYDDNEEDKSEFSTIAATDDSYNEEEDDDEIEVFSVYF